MRGFSKLCFRGDFDLFSEKQVKNDHFFQKKAKISAKTQNFKNPRTEFFLNSLKTIFPNFQLFSSKNLGGDPKNVILRKTQFSEKTTKMGEKIPKFGQNQISS